jgi:hypothetical protein
MLSVGERAPDPRLAGAGSLNDDMPDRAASIPFKETATHSAELARESTDCGCGHYDYRSEICGYLAIRYPFMCATTDDVGISTFCSVALDSSGKVRSFKVVIPVSARCRGCEGGSGRFILWE